MTFLPDFRLKYLKKVCAQTFLESPLCKPQSDSGFRFQVSGLSTMLMIFLARAREIFILRVHGCHIAFIQRPCTLLGRVSRVPQGCNRRPKQETHPNPPCLGREQVLLHQISYQFSIASIPSLYREGWGGSLNSLENFSLPMILCIASDDVLQRIL